MWILTAQRLDNVTPRSVESHSGARGNILAEPQTFYGAPLGRNFKIFFLFKMVHLAYFIFLADGGAPKRRGARGS